MNTSYSYSEHSTKRTIQLYPPLSILNMVGYDEYLPSVVPYSYGNKYQFESGEADNRKIFRKTANSETKHKKKTNCKKYLITTKYKILCIKMI